MSTKKLIQLHKIFKILSEIKVTSRSIILSEYQKSPNYKNFVYDCFMNSSVVLEEDIGNLVKGNIDFDYVKVVFNQMAFVLASHIQAEEEIDDCIKIAEKVQELFGDIAKVSFDEKTKNFVVNLEPYDDIRDFIDFGKDFLMVKADKSE